MPIEGYLQRLPLWATFILTVVIVFTAIELGFRIGRYYRNRTEDIEEAPVGSIVAATLGLLAFLLAFTFGFSANRFDTSKGLILEEANAIGTTELRASILEEPHKTIIRKALAEYVENRIISERTSERIAAIIHRSEELQDILWSQAVVLGEKHPRSVMVGLFIDSLNQMIDVHTNRLTVGLWNRIPQFLGLGLVLVTILGMAALGYHAGLTRRRNFLAILLLTFAFSLVIYLIADLDRPGSGLITANQQPLIALRDQMASNAGATGRSPLRGTNLPFPR